VGILEAIANRVSSRPSLLRGSAAVLSPALDKVGSYQALANFHRAARTRSAYRDFLERHGVRPDSVKTVEDFLARVPVMDKESYLRRYDLRALTGEDGLAKAYCIQRSSGFSGKPTYWPRLGHEASTAVSRFQLIWDLYINPGDCPTLMVVTFSLGSWQSGTELFRLGTELVVHRRRHLTVIAPGENLPETLEILCTLGPHFGQWFIVGNPPFLKRMFEEGQGVDWRGRRVIVGTGAEATTEAWREWVCARLGVDPDREPIRVINCYGSSDFGLDTATETPLSVAIKRRALRDPNLAEELFGRTGNLPNLYQYDPIRTYFEEIDGELVVTMWSAVPLIRYNIHDAGRVLSYQRVMDALKVHGCGDLADQVRRLGYHIIKAPFLWTDGRSDGTVSIGGANVFPGNIETAILETPGLAEAVQHFQLAVEEDDNCNKQLVVYVGLRCGTAEPDRQFLIGAAEEAILRTLLRDNREYEVTYLGNPTVRPRVVVVPAEAILDRGTIKRRFIRKGE